MAEATWDRDNVVVAIDSFGTFGFHRFNNQPPVAGWVDLHSNYQLCTKDAACIHTILTESTAPLYVAFGGSATRASSQWSHGMRGHFLRRAVPVSCLPTVIPCKAPYAYNLIHPYL